MNFKVPSGTQDILPGQSEKWQKVEAIIRDLCRVYRYNEIRTPIFEQTELFHTRCWRYNGYRAKRNVYI